MYSLKIRFMVALALKNNLRKVLLNLNHHPFISYISDPNKPLKSNFNFSSHSSSENLKGVQVSSASSTEFLHVSFILKSTFRFCK